MRPRPPAALRALRHWITRTRRHRVAASICAVAVLGAVGAGGAVASASTTSLSANVNSTANIVLSQSTDLTSGQTITITGAGFEPNTGLYVVECNASQPAGGACNLLSPLTQNETSTGASGTWTLQLPVVSSWGSGNSAVNCSDQTVTCAIETSDISNPYDFTQELADPITFAQTDVDNPPADTLFAGGYGSGGPYTTSIDGDLPTSLQLEPDAMAVDPNGDVAIADSTQVFLVAGQRQIAAGLWSSQFAADGAYYPTSPLGVGPTTPGDIYLVAGTGTQGFTGDGGPATDAEVTATAIAFDHEGNLLIGGGKRIRVVADRTVTAADSPYGIAMTAGDIYTIAGTGTATPKGTDPTSGIPATQAEIGGISAVTVDANGDILATDSTSQVIWAIDEQPAAASILGTPVITEGDAYVVAGTNSTATTYVPADGTGATSNGVSAYANQLAIDPSGNLVYTSGRGGAILVIAASTGTFYQQNMTAGDLYTVAGTGTAGPIAGDGGPAVDATFGEADGLAIDSSGNLLIGDNYGYGGSRDGAYIRLVAEQAGTFYGQSTTPGDIYTIGGQGTSIDPSDWNGGNVIAGIVVDQHNNLYTYDADDPGGVYEIYGAAPAIIAQPTAAGSALLDDAPIYEVGTGQPVILSAAATGDPTPTVQWQTSTDGTTWTDVSGATTNPYTTGPITAEADYRAVFTNNNGTATTADVFLEPQAAPTVTSISPTSGSTNGGTVVQITGTNFTNSDTVDFGTSSATQVSAGSGGTLLQVTTPAGTDTVPVTVSYLGNTATSPTSFTYTGGGTPPPSGTAPTVTTQPSDQTVTVGDDATFTAAASGDPTPTLQWDSSTDGTSWTAVSGATSNALTVSDTTVAESGTEYEAVFTNSAGTATTDPATLTVNAAGSGSNSESITATVPTQIGEFVWSVPTNNAVTLSNAANEGSYLESTGSLLPVTVTDTRDGGPAWSISGQAGAFSDGSGDSVPGSSLGWTPTITSSGGGATAGTAVPSGNVSGSGLAQASTLGSASDGHTLGSASLGASLDWQVPAATSAGTYTSTLTLTALS